MEENSSMLLIAPLHLRMTAGGELEIEAQAANGLLKWSEHFSKVTLCAHLLPDCKGQESSSAWIAFNTINAANTIECIALPWSYQPINYFKDFSKVRVLLEPLIQTHRYLQFCIGGCTFGDWAAVGARIAYRKKRDYSVHTDWVAHAHFQGVNQSSLYRKIRAYFDYWTMKIAERRIIKRAKLGLFHGAECYEFYKLLPRNAYLIHDIHVSNASLPTRSTIKNKADSVFDRPLRIVYAGRMHPMKGPDHWVNVLSKLKLAGISFEAKWLGDGSMFEITKEQMSLLGLDDEVQLYGFVSDRGIVLNELRQADVLMFCHLTPESPRILIEALNQATPIIGYGSDYPKDLIKRGGGDLVEQGDQVGLFEKIKYLSEHRELLRGMILKAGEVGCVLTDDNVFSHRAKLIKKELS
jgi:glycosyltransferase involved in cell wall biosynthesis